MMKSKLIAQLKLPGGDNIDAPSGVPTATGDGAFGDILSWVVGSLTVVGVITALIFLIIGSIKWITSGGDKEKLDSARKTIIFSIIGLVVVLLAFFIVRTISQILGTEANV